MAFRMHRVALLAAHGGLASTIVGPLEVLRFAGAIDRVLRGRKPRPKLRVSLTSADGQPVTCAGGITLAVEGSHADALAAKPDVIIVASPGVDGEADPLADGALCTALKDAHDRGALVAGVCSGVFILGRAGLLDGRRATTHWALGATLERRFPQADVATDQMITEDGGVNAATDLALYLVERLCGRDEARQTANALVLPLPRAAQSEYASWFVGRESDDAAVKRVQRVLANAPERPHTVEDLAREAGLTPRTLARRFRATTGETVIQCLQRLRVARAREILEVEAVPVDTLAHRVGYEDTTYFRRLFTRLTGHTPRVYRRRYAAKERASAA